MYIVLFRAQRRMHTQYTEFCNMDISGDPNSSSVLATPPHTSRKALPTPALLKQPWVLHYFWSFMLLHPSSHTTSAQCGLIKSQGLSLENFDCAGSCSGRKKGKKTEPWLLLSQCILFPSFSPLLPQSLLVAEATGLTSLRGWADRGMLRAEVT